MPTCSNCLWDHLKFT
uniref:Uncharacterized protein n=1 Tax=Arundo donax TaxID=35708 RepID=A0A0A8ZK92_ARUDO